MGTKTATEMLPWRTGHAHVGNEWLIQTCTQTTSSTTVVTTGAFCESAQRLASGRRRVIEESDAERALRDRLRGSKV